MICDWEPYECSGPDVRYKCVRCGLITAPTRSDITRVFSTCQVPGLGDRLSSFLANLGIKKKKGCGCQKRQNKLNEIDRLVYHSLTVIRKKVRHAFPKPKRGEHTEATAG